MKAILGALTFVLLAACGGTERSRITFPITATVQDTTVTTDSGWTVTLTKADAHFEAIRFYEGKVLLAQKRPWWRDVLISAAYAHPGHYLAGEAFGELVAPIDLDLLATEPEAWGIAEGVTAEYGSAQLTYGGAGVEIAGTATKADQTVTFSTSFLPPLAIEGVKFDADMSKAPKNVQLALDVAVLLSRVDFSATGTSADPLDTTSQAFNGFGRGVEDTSAYVITKQDN